MFDPRSSSLANSHDHLYAVDPLRISVDSHESCEPLNSDKTEQDSSFVDDQELQFRTNNQKNNMNVVVDDDDESGPSSPTLWKRTNSPPRTVEFLSRAQAIARGQKEMMEIVNNMPESSYELSLKDLVEHHPPIRIDHDDDNISATQEQSLIQQEQRVIKKVIKRQGSVKAKVVRSGSVDNNKGLLLKMVFPLTWKQSQRKSTISSPSTTMSTKQVTPTKSTNGDDVLEKPLRGRRMRTYTNDKDWWVKRFSSESSNGTNSSSNGTNSSSNGTNSSSSGSCSSSGSMITHKKTRNRTRSGLVNSYCSCFQSRKDKSEEYDK